MKKMMELQMFSSHTLLSNRHWCQECVISTSSQAIKSEITSILILYDDIEFDEEMSNEICL